MISHLLHNHGIAEFVSVSRDLRQLQPNRGSCWFQNASTPSKRSYDDDRRWVECCIGASRRVTDSVRIVVIVSLISTLILTWAMISESTINARLIAFDKTQRILFFVFHRKDFVNWLCLHYDIIAHVERPVASFWRRSDRIVSVA